MRLLAIAALVGIPIVFGTAVAGAPDDPACPEAKGRWLAISMPWFAVIAALAVMTLVRTQPGRAGGLGT